VVTLVFDKSTTRSWPQLKKARPPMDSKVEGNVASVISQHSKKALLPIVVTLVFDKSTSRSWPHL